jgi:hypothetical protein
MARRVDLIRVNHYVTDDCLLWQHYQKVFEFTCFEGKIQVCSNHARSINCICIMMSRFLGVLG